MPLADDIDALLPQTQCGQCGYPGCRPYAEAIAAGTTTHNRCPPGGVALELKLASLLDRPSLPLEVPADSHPGLRLEAVIREDECIGCTKCIQACPVDAIVGARQFMHTVISTECTGCGLCVEPCPVDCIDLVLRPATQQHELTAAETRHYRARFEARNARLADEAHTQAVANEKKRLRQLAARPLAALPESEANRLKAELQKTRAQHHQLQEAIRYFEKRGRPILPEQRQQLDALQQESTRLQQALAAQEQESPANSDALAALKQAVTQSELALRRAEAKRADAATLAALQQALAGNQAALARAAGDNSTFVPAAD